MKNVDRLAEIEAFVAAARHASFVRAADELGVSPSAISRRIAALERRLGVKLIYRSTRSLRLSDDGQRYWRESAEVLKLIEGIDESFRLDRHKVQGRLRMSVPTKFGHLYVASALPDFLRRYPEVDLDVEFSDRFVDLVKEGMDLALRIGSLADSSLVAQRIGVLRRVLCASPHYLAKHPPLRTPADLKQHSCLSYALLGGRGDVWQLACRGEVVAVPVSGRLRADSMEAIHAAARDGLGLAVLAQSLAQPDLDRGKLLEVLPRWRLPDAGIFVVHASGRLVPAKVRVMIEFLRAVLPASMREDDRLPRGGTRRTRP